MYQAYRNRKYGSCCPTLRKKCTTDRRHFLTSKDWRQDHKQGCWRSFKAGGAERRGYRKHNPTPYSTLMLSGSQTAASGLFCFLVVVYTACFLLLFVKSFINKLTLTFIINCAVPQHSEPLQSFYQVAKVRAIFVTEFNPLTLEQVSCTNVCILLSGFS